MGLYNFKKQFEPFILEGSKTHTIRATRKHPDKPGNTLYLYTGLRHKGAKLLFQAPCLKVEEIFIDSRELKPDETYIDMRINGIRLSWDEKNALAWRDGFRGIDNDPRYALVTMMKFWEGRLPFLGHIIHWDYSQRRKP
jgi:hypothetical protein